VDKTNAEWIVFKRFARSVFDGKQAGLAQRAPTPLAP